ncbi:uncharacterized protein LOC128987736 [Macrosteles quadrilineatus]|uniref:uncharacterized protein LOC128987736 n=1 Tax=Macrosteles quadrilineatus TaxID=74068 RepID=UPI0023E15E7C|nr:uncharacterized protein LOC128987736 [Macrosteles quadrilineatus]
MLDYKIGTDVMQDNTQHMMKRQYRGYILATFVLSLCSHGVHIVSEMSQSWVVAVTVPECHISYGLYQGSMVCGNTSDEAMLSITCLLYLNVCAWSCEGHPQDDIQELYNSGKLLHSCSNTTQDVALPVLLVRERFINGVAWLATVVAVVLSGLASLIALILTVYNVNHTPSCYWLSIRGLYLWFGSCCVLKSLSLATWGIEFYFNLSRNMGTVDTIVGLLDSNGKAHLGYSYWTQLIVIALQCCCMALLYYRETLFDKRPSFVGSRQRQNNYLGYVNYV